MSWKIGFRPKLILIGELPWSYFLTLKNLTLPGSTEKSHCQWNIWYLDIVIETRITYPWFQSKTARMWLSISKVSLANLPALYVQIFDPKRWQRKAILPNSYQEPFKNFGSPKVAINFAKVHGYTQKSTGFPLMSPRHSKTIKWHHGIPSGSWTTLGPRACCGHTPRKRRASSGCWATWVMKISMGSTAMGFWDCHGDMMVPTR